MLEATRAKNEQPFRKRLREQLNGLNKDAGRNLTVLVPVWDAVLSSKSAHPAVAGLEANLYVPQCERVSLLPNLEDCGCNLFPVIIKGELPGVPKQSSLFKDNLGHAQKPLSDMASYSK